MVVRYIGVGSPPVGPFPDVAETIVDSGTAPIQALLHAATLDFSPRALKSIIFFDCQHPRCTVSVGGVLGGRKGGKGRQRKKGCVGREGRKERSNIIELWVNGEKESTGREG